MVSRILIIASAVYVINLVNGLSEPFPGFHPCKASDDECLLDNAKNGVKPVANGIPLLGVKPLEPLKFKELDASSNNLKFTLYDIDITGIQGCLPIKAKRDEAKSQMYLEIQCALKLTGNYKMDGTLLLLKINGTGKTDVFVRNILNKVLINYIIKKGKDNKEYIRFKNFDHTYELKENSDVSFTGLFEDNNVLSQAANDVIKNNGNEIINEIGQNVFKACIKEIVENINRLLSVLPNNEITLV